jgi:HK97 family phage major capsid protein
MMDIKTATIDELMERRTAILASIDEVADSELEALDAEVRSIGEELEARKAAAEARENIRAQIASGNTGTIVEEIKTEDRTMSEIEVRNTKPYIDAYAEYIKSGNDKEVRALLTENVSGTVPVPEMVYDIVKTAWEKEGIMSYVRKSYLRGNLKVGFEISSTAATNHTESTNSPVSEEQLVLGVVTLLPISIKKWISVTDEVRDMRGEEFLRYIYDELTYRIAKKAADNVIAAIEACGTASTTTCPGVPKIAATTISVGLVAQALAQLSDEAANPVVMMNKATWGAFKAAQYAASYPVDPFEGLPVLFNNTIAAFSAATTGVTYMIVGDLGHGAIANFPNGEDIDIKVDEYTDMTKDLIRILGREYVAVGVVAPDAFVKVTH